MSIPPTLFPRGVWHSFTFYTDIYLLLVLFIIRVSIGFVTGNFLNRVNGVCTMLRSCILLFLYCFFVCTVFVILFVRTYWTMRKLGVEEWLVSAVKSMYAGAKTVVRTVYSNSKGFEVKVGMHQGSALSPLLFVIVMEAISREFRVALPWELLYADDLTVIAETEEELIKRLNEWKDNVESKGMRVNMNKTKVMISGER